MLKVKHERECDCVVAGFRWHKGGDGAAVGSLLLGLYDDDGHAAARRRVRELHDDEAPRAGRVPGAVSRGRARRSSVASEWARVPRRRDGGDATRGAAQRRRAASRWSQGKDLSWEPLRPELVVEVAYDHMQGARFRHTAQFRRWRTDKPPRDCTYAQLEVVPPHELAAILRRSDR